MRKNLFVTVFALVAMTVLSVGQALAAPTEISIVERPGYFETKGNVFNVKPGEYVFNIENKAQKDAGFVLSRDGEDDKVVLVKDGEKGTLTADLKPGKYSYYCPIIPTPKYNIIVK